MSGLGTLGTIGSASSSVFGGMGAQEDAAQQSEYALASAVMAGKESSRQAALSATAEKEAYQDTIRKQKLAYLKSGVDLEGTPLTVMAETKAKGESNIDEILSSGASRYAASMTEGLMLSQKAKAMGRESLWKGLSSGASQLLTMAA